jgi:AraC-like DNA-binding protein
VQSALEPNEQDTAALCDQLRAANREDRMRLTERWLSDAALQSCSAASLRLKLLDAGRAIASAVCRKEPGADCQCDRVAWTAIAAITESAQDPRAGFLDLAEALFAQVDREHPMRSVDRAAAMIRACPQRRWPVSALAAQVGEPPRRLCSLFSRQFGIGIGEYVHLARVTCALQIIDSTWKAAAISGELGYRSKKDCYAAMERWLGVTPGRLRAWSPERRRAAALRLETLLRCGTGPSGLPDPAYQRLRPRLARASSSARVAPTSAAPPRMATPA